MRAALFLLVTSTACAGTARAQPPVSDATNDRATERAALVRELAADFGDEAIDRRVLDAIGTVPRHRFVPEAQAHAAYENRPLPIGHGQTISQPYIVALMTDVLEPRRDMRVLEIGTGSGYQAAILAGLVERVDTIEIVVPLAAQAKARLDALGYGNVEVRQADGYYGWPGRGPYDAIIVTAAAGSIPPPLVAQLKPGGRMVIPVGAPFLTQTLVLVEKRGDGTLRTRQLLPVRFVPLTGAH
ncbi:MAG TPA: protein-L-isoaspartate(D-aspartate) O-methyltransferase [Candidatus Saccharimonadia bacterium]|nr:protein-L-isoaspartate(D-aspartate) O-methyltransferase [Candidatus Saccharimonadia bacterium]